MTLSDPLLKELKGHIGALIASRSGPYSDDDEAVFPICHSLEAIFLKGLIRHDGFTPWRTDCFQWFHQLVRKYNRVLPLTFRGAFDDIMNDKKVKTNTGKTRLLIRHCLKRKCLHTPVQFQIDNQDYADMSLRVNYNPDSSVLGHEILSQIFLSLLLQLSNLEFNFDLGNSSFLDESWQIPKLFKTELVPCEKLGLTLGFPMGYAVVVRILEHSVAAEYSNKIEVGDILDEFNDVPVRHFYGSKIESIFKKCKKKPFKITFIKSKDPVTSEIFLPAIKLYRILGMDPELLNYPEPAYRRRALTSQASSTEFCPTCGKQNTGNSGQSQNGCCEPTSLSGNVNEAQLISVEVEVERQQDQDQLVPETDQQQQPSNINDTGANSTYLDLLSSLVETNPSPYPPPAKSTPDSATNATLDLLTGDSSDNSIFPDLLTPQSQDAPAQLVLESNDNQEISLGSNLKGNDKPAHSNSNTKTNSSYNNSTLPSQYYDDSSPFLV